MSELLSGRDVAEIQTVAARSISVPPMKRKYVQKPTNISKIDCKVYKKKKWSFWLILSKDYLLSNPKNFDVHFEQTHTKP